MSNRKQWKKHHDREEKGEECGRSEKAKIVQQEPTKVAQETLMGGQPKSIPRVRNWMLKEKESAGDRGPETWKTAGVPEKGGGRGYL